MDKKGIKILLVIPPVLYTRQPYIGAAYLSSYLKNNGYETKIWDLNTEILICNDGDNNFWSKKENSEKFFLDHRELFSSWVDTMLESKANVIGFTIWRSTEYLSLALAKNIKEKDNEKTIIFGGYLCNIKYKELISYPYVDVVVVGEGEETLVDVLNTIGSNKRLSYCPGAIFKDTDDKVIESGLRKQIHYLDSLPFPDFSDFKLEKYVFKNHMPLLFSRGCSWRCSFCATGNVWKNFSRRTPENILREIILHLNKYPGLKQFELCDSAFNQDLNLLSVLCDLIIAEGLNVKFCGFAQIKPDMDFVLLQKMKKAGFATCNYGLESGSNSVLASMGKKYTQQEAERVIKDTYNAGIDVVLNFIVGYPTETEDDFQESLNFIERVKNHVSVISPAHQCDIIDSYIHSHPEKFNIVFPDQDVTHWETVDGKINGLVKKLRMDTLNRFVEAKGIRMRDGSNDRREMEMQKN